MALIKCRECGQVISDMADHCPKCGCPVVNESEETQYGQTSEQMVYQDVASSGNGSNNNNKLLYAILAFLVAIIIGGGIFYFIDRNNKMEKALEQQQQQHVADSLAKDSLAKAQVIKDSLNTLRKLGVFDYESQVEMLSQQLAVELGKGNTQGVNNIQKMLDILAEYGGASYAINERLDNDRLQLSLVKSKYEEAKVDATEFIPHKFVVTSAFQAERKSYPVRWIILVVTVLSTFLLLLFCIVVYDQSKDFFRHEAEKEAASKEKKKHLRKE